MKKDIQTREDIELLVRSFYEKIKKDSLIGPIFTDIAKVNWERHLPVMYDFWENSILFTGSYSGNPMIPHQHLHRAFPLTEDHFNRWVYLFTNTVDEWFEGEKARLAKQRALSIATVMKLKIIGQADK